VKRLVLGVLVAYAVLCVGTVAAAVYGAAEALGRRWLGCELTEAYGSLIRQRTAQGGLPWPEEAAK